MLKTSPTTAAWKTLFERFPIQEKTAQEGFFRLTAEQIRKTGREPRLMTKFDSRDHRPKPLVQAGITILPISNGEYVLLKGDGYTPVPQVHDVETYDAGKVAALETIQWGDGIRGESQAIDTLFMASALKTFVDDKDLQLTMRGRLRSSRFQFTFEGDVKPIKINVDGVQIEVDAGFEGNKVVILEAKFGSLDDFIVRQLYYPYRNLLELGVKKQIIPILLTYSNRVYSLYQFEFSNTDLYQIHLVRQKSYSLEELKPIPRFADVTPKGMLRIPATGAPFPQADDLSKVFDVTDLLLAGPMRKEEITAGFDVDPRQGDYYGNAAAWLGLTKKKNHQFILTDDGLRFSKMNRTDRIVEIARRLKALPAFSETAYEAVKGHTLPPREIAAIISRKYGLTGATPLRRASTVKAWIDWLSRELR
jgi:hypothetical protein